MEDLAIIFLSVLLALVLAKTETLSSMLGSVAEWNIIGSFIAGMFFTSIFTTAPAIVVLGDIAQNNSIFLTALFGAMGCVIGDLIILRFIKDRLSGHFIELVGHRSLLKRFKYLLKMRYFRWFTFLVGGVIIASPFPEEIGIALMGITKIKASEFIPISFFFNFLGILVIGYVANAI